MYYTGVFLERQKKHEKVSQYNRFADRDLNRGPPECEAKFLAAQPRHLVKRPEIIGYIAINWYLRRNGNSIYFSH
jgi:hypothetical protein